ncbi:MAG TPA: hypothetical protein VGB64_02040 [Actinomycetota bacterium]
MLFTVRSVRGLALAATLLVTVTTFTHDAAVAAATPRAACGSGSHPETGMQGRVTEADIESGYAADGIRCNAEMAGRFGASGVTGGAGGYKVFRYVDTDGRECAYYDSTLLFPLNAPKAATDLPGVIVLDMSIPAAPVKTANLVTPAMLSPHESLSLNEGRGLLAAVAGNPLQAPGIVDVYDVSQDCRAPVLMSSTPLGLIGHEGGFAPDGLTYWATSTGGNRVTAVDVADPSLPSIAWTGEYNFHGINVSDLGTRLYAADLGRDGLTILDVSQVQARATDPVVTEVSHITWPTVSIPQVPIPVTIAGNPYLIEIDEFSTGLGSGSTNGIVGAARIIDIADDTNPVVVSDLRLEVHDPANRAAIADDPGAAWFLGGYTGHYCGVPQREEPGIVACSFILSGVRVFDIRDPLAPKEAAYFNAPIPKPSGLEFPGGSDSSLVPHVAYAMSAPAFAPERGELWYTDGSFGFFNVRLTNGAWQP